MSQARFVVEPGLHSDEGELARRMNVNGILESITDAFQLFDAEWRFLYLNPAARRFFARHGIDAASLVGKRFWDDVLPEATESDVARQMRRAMDDRVPVAFESYYAPWDAWLFSRFDPLPDGGLANYFQDITEQKRSAERLRTHEQRLAAELAGMLRLHEVSTRLVTAGERTPLLIELVDAAIALTGADMGNIQLLDESTGALRIVASRGFDAPFLEFFDSVEREEAPCGAAMRGGRRVVVEDVTSSPILEGTPALAVLLEAGVRAVQSTPLIVASGRLVGVLSTHYRMPRCPAQHDLRVVDLLARQAADWIERTQEEDSLRESEERFRRYFELGLVGMAITSPTKGCIAVNERICSMLGYTREELLRKRWDEMTHPADLAADLAQFHRVMRGETDGYSIEKRWIHKDGSVVDSVISVSCARRPDRSIEYFAALVEDVTERKCAERALRASEERYRCLVEQVQDYAIFSTDARGVVTSWNEGCRQAFGYSEHEFLGLEVDALFAIEDRAAGLTAARFRLAVETGAARIDSWMLARNGRRFFATGGTTALSDPAQGCIGFSMILRDVTQLQLSQEATAHRGESLARLVSERTDELEQATARLRLTERLATLGTLAAGLGHDLGNLLLPLDVRLQLLRKADLSPALREHVTGITRCVGYLRQLAGGLSLLVTDPTQERFTEPTELHAWWSDVAVLLRNVLPPGVVFHGEIPSTETWVSIARVGLTQAVFNAVQNAADALSERGTGHVRVSLDEDGPAGMVALRVTDDGPGMTDEVERRCMEPYFSTKARGISTGMGLALVHALVTAAGGRVEVSSTLGVGTTVRLLLPGARLARRTAADAPHIAVVRIKDALVRSFVSTELRALGFTVRSHRSREEPDMIVVDSTRARERASAAALRHGAVTIPIGPHPTPETIHEALRSAAAAFPFTDDAGAAPAR